MLLRAREFYEKILRQAGDDPRLRSEHSRTCLRLAKIFIWLKDFPEAIAQSEEARAILGDMPPEERDDPENQELLGRSSALSGLARWWRFEWSEALKDLDSAASIYAKLTREHSDVLEYHALECSILNLLGRQACRLQGREREGVQALERCLAICESMAAKHTDSPEFPYEKARALITLGEHDDINQRHEAAKKRMTEARGVLGDLVGRFPMVADYKLLYAQLYPTLINIESSAGHTEGVRAAFDKMRPIVERLSRESPDVSAFRECLAIGDASFAAALSKIGLPAEAETWAERALARSPTSGIVMFVSACSYSLSSGAVAADPSLGPADRLQRRGAYCSKAMRLLLEARDVGLFKDPIYVRQMADGSDFDPMKTDPDFDRLLDELRLARRTP